MLPYKSIIHALRSRIKKIVLMLGVGSTALVLAACYGVPVNFKSRIVLVQTANSLPIPGLTLEMSQSGTVLETQVSDEYGTCTFQDEEDSLTAVYTARDTDGAANLGDFADQTASTADLATGETLVITMEPKP